MLKAMTGLLLVGALAISGRAMAHPGHDHGKDQHVKGTVTAIDDSKVTLKAVDGKPVNVHVDDKTQYENSGAEGKLADLKAGARVVVHGETMKDGTLHATKVRFGKAAAKATTAKPPAGPAKPAAKSTPAKPAPAADQTRPATPAR